MKVKLTLDVDEATRYVIAKFFEVESSATKKRSRATRAQVRWFAKNALKDAVADRIAAYGSRTRTVANRLAVGSPKESDDAPIVPYNGRQQSLW